MSPNPREPGQGNSLCNPERGIKGSKNPALRQRLADERNCATWAVPQPWNPAVVLAVGGVYDNLDIEALFRTTKYWSGYPYRGFATIDEGET